MTRADGTLTLSEADQEIRVPLDMESVFGWGTWLLIGLVVLFLSLPLFLVALRLGEFALGVVAGAGVLFGFHAFRKVLHLLTKSLVISSNGISWRRGLRTRRLDWKDVRFYHHGLMVRTPPHHARFEVRGPASRACFEIRIVWYEDILSRLGQSCPQAFAMDYATGQIYPPRKNDMANFMRAEFQRIARREASRFRLLAIAQIAGLPVLIVLAVAVLFGPIWVAGWTLLPYGPSDIQANFSRARYAWQSYATSDSMNADANVPRTR